MNKNVWWIVLVLFLVFLPRPALSQSEVSLSAVKVDLWPEFDQPNMLVIYHVTLAPDTPLPSQVTFRIPDHVGEPNAVAIRQPNGGLFNVSYDRQVSDGWSEISFTATSSELQLEYYDDLIREGSNRSFAFTWPGDYAVGNLLIEVQQPVDTASLGVSPVIGQEERRTDNLVYHMFNVGALRAGQDFTIRISYDKSSESLSAANQPVVASAPIQEATAQITTLPSVWPWLLGGFGLLLIGIGAWWYWRLGQGQGPVQPKRSERRRSVPVAEVVGALDGHTYCSQCGKRAAVGDRFCRVCGSRLGSGGS
ncbi:MAG TPA: zinc ribbon domain-containing protein [Anaerolineales bacterium]|nr:zinc ribbon domain-containing protein [Anaerolineales bacterium]